MFRHRGFTLAALVTLALGIGANTAIFSIVYGVLFRPLPYEHADRLIRLGEEHPGGTAAVRGLLLTNRTYHSWLERPHAIESLAAFSRTSYTLSGLGDPVRTLPREFRATLRLTPRSRTPRCRVIKGV